MGVASSCPAALAVAAAAAVAALSALAWQGLHPEADNAGSHWLMGLLGLAVMLPPLWLGRQLQRQQRTLEAQARRLAHQDAQLDSLARSTDLLRQAEQVAEIGSFDWNPVTGALHWSDGHFRLWGHAPGALTPDDAAFRARIHPDDLDALEARLQHTLKTGSAYEFTHRVRWPDGTVLELLARGDVTRDARGRAVRLVGTVQDITRRRRAEARLQLHECLVNTITDPVSVVDESGVYRLVNQAWSQRTGLTSDQVVGQAVGLQPAVLQQQLGSPAQSAALQRCLASGQPEVVLAALDLPATGRRWWETTLFPLTAAGSGPRGAALVARDVTARQAAVLALEASVDTLRMALNATGDAIFASSDAAPDAPLLFINDRMLQLWGIPPEQAGTLTLAAVLAVVLPQCADPAREAARVARIIASGSRQDDRVALRDGRVLLRRCIPTQQAGRAVRVWSWCDTTALQHTEATLLAAKMASTNSSNSTNSADRPLDPPAPTGGPAAGSGPAGTPGTAALGGPSSAPVPAPSAAGAPVRVLYIDDNPVNTLLMAAMFERLPGLALQCECDPLAGLALALADPPALLLVDIQMPVIDGFEVLRRLRAHPATRAVPAVAVSANAMPQDLARGRAAGFADYLTKPLELQRLQDALVAVLPGWQAPPH